ncbi:AAA family ATPase [Endozoicomonas numazuensis]|uniref:ATPase n=1 Tax=Endozoicomonas numazuensis TaxID=1137799 RepID=A0A081NMQ2_9GAMM|nr:AAA family ATPase [Endozoicomonas numazuensis]KEQ19725.1 ATPase [Endozoicomonas numazuensis]
MIKVFEFKNLGPLDYVAADNLGQINLIIGPNSAGKTWLLKALYAAIRTLEETGRGHSNSSLSDVLSDKLYWTFQSGKLGDIVSKGKGKKLSASVTLKGQPPLDFSFGQDTAKQVGDVTSEGLHRREANSIFMPPKEVLSLDKIILQTAIIEKQFGFDSTYTDLVLALQKQEPQGKSNLPLAQTGHALESMFAGRIEYDRNRKEWIYKVGNTRFSINATAEGIKKIGILDILIRNQYLTQDSVVFIDEPESALHPTAITQLFDIIELLAKQGMQFFIASHSYYVVKKLYITALQENIDIPVLIANGNGQWQQASLKDGIPDNEIINESVRLFEQEIGVA